MKRGLKPTAAAVALVLSCAVVAAMTSRGGAEAAVTAPSKASVVINAQVLSVAKAAHLTSTQIGNARTVVAVVVARNLPKRAAVIALATAMQESKLRNVHYGDRDSLGLFQQRPSMGWGTKAQVLDPKHATQRFLSALARVPGWRTLPVTKAAQDVQRSAFPTAYARWEPLAKKLADALLPHGAPKAPSSAGSAVPKAQEPARPRLTKPTACLA